ncbi:C6 transcription factor (Mut3) [Fusarium mundagurra]|uniref:C6 transcription factor (Mut3) n=1 Tax=Fusarium mundagurra TaxID=1567541 RepID=A0A8H5XSS8_9HYPO|nr:C6 transcription factor (Mut3) [Fusarium mundagurra]
MAPLSSGEILAETFSKDGAPFSSEQAMPLPAELPDLAECQRLCYIAIEEALPCHECIDREAFFAELIRVHAKPREELDPNDRAFLALVFALLGFAKRYDADNHSTTEAYSNHDTIKQAWRLYESSLQMLQLDDLCSLDILRAIIYQVLFLASSCMLSKAYTRLSIGVATALRIDTDQILPLRDENLADHGISFVRQNPHTPEAETLVICSILLIMAEIHTHRNPLGKGMALNSNSRTYTLTSQDVASLDAQLTEWYNSLPTVGEIPPVKRALHAQLAIRHTYAITQMALHRPFLHHLTRKANDHSFCMEGYAYGSQCITAAMQTVWLLQRLDDQGLLHESIWFYISSLAFAASSLMFFVLGSPYSTTVRDATQAAFKAHGLLEKLGRRNETAQRCFESIDFLMA